MSDKEQRRVPELRFKGFTEDWEQRKISDVSKIVSGGTPNTNKPEYWNGNINWYSPAEIGDKIFVSESQRKITELGLKNSSAKILPKDKTILFTSRAGIGDMAILQEDGATNQGFQSLVLKENTNVYFQYTMKSILKREALKMASGSTFLEISGKELEKISLNYPEMEEQKQIANFFKSIDELVSLYQRKLQKLKQLKQGYLQKLFPDQGAKAPELRFEGFTENWEQRKLYDIAEKIKSYPLSRSIEVEKHTGYKYIHYGDIHTRKVNLIHDEDVLPNIISGNYITLKEGDIVIADASEDYQGIATPSLLNISPTNNIVAGLHTIAIRPISTDSLYLYYMFHTKDFRKHGYRMGTGMKVFGITFNNFINYEFQLPQLSEQQKISKLLLNLDKLSNLYQYKTEESKRNKKILLQKMFI